MIPEVNKKFLNDFSNALKPLNIKAGKKVDLWMNDEVIQYFTSDIGKFELSIDVWDCVFIMSKSQKGILRIDNILQENPQFAKEEVDFKEYQKNPKE